MKHLGLLVIILLVGIAGMAQVAESKLDFRLGVGTSPLGTVDINTGLLMKFGVRI